MTKVAIIGAMSEEVEALKAKIVGLKTQTIGGCQYHTGSLAGVEVILNQSGIGKVAAAMSTAILFERFAPDCVINTGSAGGFDPQLAVGDIVLSVQVRHHDVDVTAFGYEIGQVPNMPAAFVADTHLLELARRCIQQIDGVQVKAGLICTGDQFMCKPEHITQVRAHFPEMLAAEMEAAAIAQVCYQFKVPFVIVRSLSDIAGQESPISFPEYLETAAKNATTLILHMLVRLKQQDFPENSDLSRKK